MNKSRLPGPVILIILSLITIVIWTSFELLRTFTRPVDVAVSPEILNPINPQLDSQTLDKLDAKIYLNDDEIADLPITQTAAPLPTPQASASPEPSPLAEEELPLDEEILLEESPTP